MAHGSERPAPAEATPARDAKGTMFLTLTLIVEPEALTGQFGDRWSLGARRAFRRRFENSDPLLKAIEPLFDDISDRRRHLYVDDFLLDTPSTLAENVNEVIEFRIPQVINWSTEGAHLTADLGLRPQFQAKCRMFWFCHSNGALSYQVSFELDYAHSADQYYALSLLQKLIFAKEGTEWARDAVRLRRGEGRAEQDFWSFIRENFERHAYGLFERLKVLSPGDTSRIDGSGYWDLLLLRPGPGAGGPAAQRRDPFPERRAVIVLRDPYFLSLLQADRRRSLEGFGGIDLSDMSQSGTVRLNAAFLRGIAPAQLDGYFLSGFFQNIIDFLRQDTSEVRDGTDPIYPAPGEDESNSPFIVYANPTTIFEVVGTSRSLDIGQKYIGTCPYLFLVHMMTFHNEALARMFERQVMSLIAKLEKNELMPSADEASDKLLQMGTDKITAILRDFLNYRLAVFHEIKKHMYFNVLRYDTERAFYDEIVRVRGIDARFAYWEGVLENLQQTVESLQQTVENRRERERQEREDKLNAILLIVAGFSVLQVSFQASESLRRLWRQTSEPVALSYDILSHLAMWALLVWLCWEVWRRWSGRDRPR